MKEPIPQLFPKAPFLHLQDDRVLVRTKWLACMGLFVLVALLDFLTPSQYILAGLYILPILLAVTFFKPHVGKFFLLLSVLATLLNLVWPESALTDMPTVVNRFLAAASIVVAAFFMVRYKRYQHNLYQREQLLSTERYLAQTREDFIATLTHDLKTPMLGEDKTLQYCIDGAFGEFTNQQRDILSALKRGNRRQLDLVDSLLSAYRYDQVGVGLSLSEVDMDEVVADILTEFQHLAFERQITVTYQCQNQLPRVPGDALQLKRVVANLLHNALNYTPAQGVISVSISVEPMGLCVMVADTGPGIPESDLSKVFHRFYRSDIPRQMAGSGLGLYLSRQIIQAHHGRIWVENRLSPQTGCCFWFTLPLKEARQQAGGGQ